MNREEIKIHIRANSYIFYNGHVFAPKSITSWYVYGTYWRDKQNKTNHAHDLNYDQLLPKARTATAEEINKHVKFKLVEDLKK